MSDEVVKLPTDDILALRVRVLRKGTPYTNANYPEDEYPDAVNFCIVRNGQPVATSTWFTKECPEIPGAPAMQLKGMAVDVALADRRVGAISKCARDMNCGGVGTYYGSGFVHLDVGPVRTWGA